MGSDAAESCLPLQRAQGGYFFLLRQSAIASASKAASGPIMQWILFFSIISWLWCAVADHAPSAIDEIADDRASHDAKPDDSNGLVLESSFPAVEFD
jgi:hypothetical protein